MNSNFIRSIAILSGSNLIAQAINFITYLILPKYFYTPDDFGVFGLFLAIYFVLFEIINLKMDQSIMLPDSNREAKGLLGFSWLVAIGLSVVLFASFQLINFFGHFVSSSLICLITLSLILGGLIQPAMVYLNRQSAYFRMGNVRIVQAVVTLAASIGGYYWMHETVNGLIMGFIAGQLIAAFILLTMVMSSDVHIAGKSLLLKYKQFMQFGSLSAMISTLSRNLPAFIIKPVFGNAALGHYTLAVKYLNAPVGIFSSSVAQVYFKDASTATGEELETLTRKVILNILAIAAIPCLVLLLFGGGLFGYVFGQEWTQAGQMIQVLILWYFVAYASGPVSMLLDVKLKLDWELSYNILLLLGRSAALASVLWLESIWIVLAIYTLVGIIFNVYLLSYILKLSKKDAKS